MADYQAIAEAVGRKVLGLTGSEFLELIYLLEEKNTLAMLRQFVLLDERNQEKVIAFFKAANRRANLQLDVGAFGILISSE